MELTMTQENEKKRILEDIAREKMQQIKKFYTHLFIYSIGVAIFVSKKYFGLPLNFWPINFINSFFMWCWTFIIAVQAIKLFMKDQFLGKNWEERKIQEIIEKEKTNKQNWE
ncbi:2TM domain-containing protein [Flavobacterium sp.]|uniref:2TM domain-containing protein n=1 Tax=Flavobacterium sp. TaxID=239 RepID=UPI0040482AE1